VWKLFLIGHLNLFVWELMQHHKQFCAIMCRVKP
jgi:hypothetical protein